MKYPLRFQFVGQNVTPSTASVPDQVTRLQYSKSLFSKTRESLDSSLPVTFYCLAAYSSRVSFMVLLWLAGECRCNLGYSGPGCRQCKKLPGCQHGHCTKSFECR